MGALSVPGVSPGCSGEVIGAGGVSRTAGGVPRHPPSLRPALSHPLPRAAPRRVSPPHPERRRRDPPGAPGTPHPLLQLLPAPAPPGVPEDPQRPPSGAPPTAAGAGGRRVRHPPVEGHRDPRQPPGPPGDAPGSGGPGRLFMGWGGGCGGGRLYRGNKRSVRLSAWSRRGLGGLCGGSRGVPMGGVPMGGSL